MRLPSSFLTGPRPAGGHTSASVPASRPGFALVITVSLLVLLALIAVGLLTLSTVQVRSASHGAAQAEAQANARLALMLAIGQLQKAAGPDQRITAPATLGSPDSSPALTGVWESFRLDPEGYRGLDEAKKSPRSDEDANGEFVGWLSSDGFGGDPTLTPPDTTPGTGRGTVLRIPELDQDSEVAAKLLPVGDRGNLAWITMDEGVKARFNLPEIAAADDEARRARLRAPERPAVQVLPALQGYLPDRGEAAKVTSYPQGILAASDRADYARRFHDLTPWSAGLATNVVGGGLKGDLTLAFEQDTLPKDLADRHVYANRSGQPLSESDPRFTTLADHYRLYKQVSASNSTPLSPSIPAGYTPKRRDREAPTTVPNPAANDGAVIAPVVTRVNVVFSMVGREAHANWATTVPNRSDGKRQYMVYLIYTPVVTLYNPYTAPIRVDGLKVSFQYLPLAFQFYRNGNPQTQQPALLSQFHISSQNSTDWEDRFTCTLSSDSGSGQATPVTLQPGEARVFGVNHPAGTTWGQMTNYLWQNDLHLSKTLDLTTREGWNYNSGFIVDWLAPAGAGRTADNLNLGVFGVEGRDRIDVAITPKVPSWRGREVDYFGVEVEARINRRDTTLASYRYKYGSRDRLVEAMEAGTHPSIGKVEYPVHREKPWNFNELYQRAVETTPVERWTGPKQFAIFTLADRTAEDSLFATKPGRDTSFVHQVMDMDITKAHPAQMPMELSFLPVTGQGANTAGSIEVFSADDPRSFFFSGWRLLTGLTNYPTYEVPRAPMMTIADLRHANLASSGHLPMPAYTVGESRAHPLIPADKALADDSTLGYRLADHAWLANNVLWDNYYFSGIRNRAELDAFLDGEELPLAPQFQAHLPAGRTAGDSGAALAGSDGWRSAAAHQIQHGAFNVHSTSVEAWKTVLSSLRDREVPVRNPETGAAENGLTEGAPMPRMLDGSSDRIDRGRDATNQNRWAGYRDLTEEEIQRLAEEVVEGIRERGPFLSMSEFVNRRLDGPADTTALAGILQEAITRAGINDESAPANSRLITNQETGDYEYAYPEAALGDTQEGAASFLSQGDLLSAIGARITVRSDTFLVRARGESRDGSGKLVASALCEAVVQRVPDFVDPADPADADPGDDGGSALSEVNQRFGRQLRVVSFRWIANQEA